MFENLKHNLSCGITLDNTKLVDDNYKDLGWMKVECIGCGKQYIAFRSNGNIIMENILFVDDQLNNGIMEKINNFKEWLEYFSNNYIIQHNFYEWSEYPFSGKDILIISMVDKKTGKVEYTNIGFEEIGYK